MHGSSAHTSEIATGLCWFLDQNSPLFYQKCNAWRQHHGIDWTPRDNSLVSFKFKEQSKVSFDCSRCQCPNDPFPFEICVSPLRRLCWLWYVLMRESKFSSMMCGLQWYVGWPRSIQVVVFSSVVASASNISMRADIFIRRLGCLNAQN